MRPSELQTIPEPFPLVLERTLTTDFDTLSATFSISSDNDTNALLVRVLLSVFFPLSFIDHSIYSDMLFVD